MTQGNGRDLVPAPNGKQPTANQPANLVSLFLPGERRAYCSFDLSTPAGRELLQKCEEQPDEPVRELVGAIIGLVHVYAKMADAVNEETGEVRPYLRICLIDDGGRIYACGSEGIRDGIARVIAGHGPPPWKTPVRVRVGLKTTRHERQRLTLLEVFDQSEGGGK